MRLGANPTVRGVLLRTSCFIFSVTYVVAAEQE